MIETMDVRNTTEQLGVVGPVERAAGALPLRVHAEQRRGDPVGVPRAAGADRRGDRGACARIAKVVAPLLLVSEIRTVAADELWLSSAYGTDVVGLHFTWVRDQAGVEAVLPALEDALLPLGARPHWGKLYLDRDGVVPSLYPRLDDFRALARSFDPDGVFTNDFVARYLQR